MPSGRMTKYLVVSRSCPAPYSSSCELRDEEVGPAAGGAVHDVDRVDGTAGGVGSRPAQRPVMELQLGQRLTVLELEVPDDVVALRHAGLHGEAGTRRAWRGRGGRGEHGGDPEDDGCKPHVVVPREPRVPNLDGMTFARAAPFGQPSGPLLGSLSVLGRSERLPTPRDGREHPPRSGCASGFREVLREDLDQARIVLVLGHTTAGHSGGAPAANPIPPRVRASRGPPRPAPSRCPPT